MVISFGVDLPEGKRKRLETMAGRDAVRNTIGKSHLLRKYDAKWESTFPCVVASERQPRCAIA